MWALYGLGVARARDPVLYGAAGVPDTSDGRFELVAAHTALLARRLGSLGPDGRAMAQRLTEAMMNDMDRSLREMGVGDLKVGKWVRPMAESLIARLAELDRAVPAGDAPAIAAMLARNLGATNAAPSLGRVATALLAFAAELDRADPAGLLAGHLRRIPGPEASSAAP